MAREKHKSLFKKRLQMKKNSSLRCGTGVGINGGIICLMGTTKKGIVENHIP
jgi:hypothetical protein